MNKRFNTILVLLLALVLSLVLVGCHKNSLTLSKEKLTLEKAGETYQIVAKENDKVVTDKVKWSIKDEKVATVSDKGLVTAVANGETVVTAETKEAKATLNVTVDIKGMQITKEEIILGNIGDTELVVVLFNGEKGVSGITWASDNEAVVTVDNNGTVTAVAEGQAKVTATKDGVKAVVTIKVEIPKLNINKKAITLKGKGAMEQLVAKIGSDAVGSETIFASDNEEVATVDAEGKITAVSDGTANITVTRNTETLTCVVTVIAELSVEFNSDAITDRVYGKYKDSMTTVMKDYTYPTYTTDKTSGTLKIPYKVTIGTVGDSEDVVWSTSDASVADVAADGTITIKSAGLAVITVKTVATQEQEVNQGMTTVKVIAPAEAAIILLAGPDNTATALPTFFAGLTSSQTGYTYKDNFKWKGFNSSLSGQDADPNKKWLKTELVEFDATVALTLSKNGTFAEKLGYMPRAGWVATVDESLPETTIGEAKAKYGNARRYPGGMFTQSGSIHVFGDNLYLVYFHTSTNTSLEGRIRNIGKLTDTEIKGYKPFEFMSGLYEGLNYTLKNRVAN